MTKIKNTKLLRELLISPQWETLFTTEPRLKDEEIPVLAGGLDRIEVKRNRVEFHDIGRNGRDNSFAIVGQ